jgi:hypothetical protein
VLRASGGSVVGASALASTATAAPSAATGEDAAREDDTGEDATGPERAQEETTTDDGGARITTTMAIERVPRFDGNYESQFLVVQSTKYSPERTPGLEDCSGVDWNVQNTQSHDGAIIDRASQDPTGARVTIHVADEDREFRPGQTFVISDATECGDYVALGVEGVGPRSLAGKQTLTTVGEDGGGGSGGNGGSGSTPGFTVGGAVAGIAALFGLGAARRASDDD